MIDKLASLHKGIREHAREMQLQQLQEKEADTA